MIQFNEFSLENGLQVIVHEDPDAHLAVLNVLYKVGSRNEDPTKTGFAHLFEHLMFGGSANIPSYDEPLQAVGGDNNAFTTPDITNYYLTLPANNLETGFWLESDRMMSLSFNDEVLEVQRKVVIEEFKQRYLNQPYGDVWLKLRPLTYKTHPYRWPTIGKDISHIENAVMEDVRDFFERFYVPSNAIVVVAGSVTTDYVEQLARKWFGPIPEGNVTESRIPTEPAQTESRFHEITANVPQDSIYLAYHMAGRTSDSYHAADLLSDILGGGKSSRLYRQLVKERKLFSTIEAYVTGSVDPGLLVISGMLNPGKNLEEGQIGIKDIVNDIFENKVSDKELEKVKNQAESSVVFAEMEILNRAMNIAYGAALNNPNMINEETRLIRSLTLDDIHATADSVLRDENSSVLYYKSA